MKIILGSLSEEKLTFAKTAFEQLHLVSNIQSVDVNSEVDEQPLDIEMTTQSAINRAKNAREQAKDADFWIGLEGGLHDYGEGFHLITVCCLLDTEGNIYVGYGTELHLPEKVSEDILQGEFFADALTEYMKDYEVDENIITRETPFIESVQHAYAKYILEKKVATYRLKALGIIYRESDKKFLLIQKPHYDDADWDFPGGGVDKGESGEEAVLRELHEELGTDKFEIIEESDIEMSYPFPDYLIARWLKNSEEIRYKGQTQLQYIIKFIGKDSDIKIDRDEISKYKWVRYDELFDHLNMSGQEENMRKVIENSSLKL